jgi:AraC-like DNA-binding protein
LLIRIQNLIESRKRLREKFQRELIIKPSEMAVNSIDEQFITRLLKMVEEHIGDEKFGVEQLALEIGMSRSQIHRKMIALTNQAPNQFIRTFRLTRAMELLKKKAATASEIAYQVGFSSPSYFTKCFREEFGNTPSEIS